MSDKDWFAYTGNCGACGSPVEGVKYKWLCKCSPGACGCGPHPAIDQRAEAVPHEVVPLFDTPEASCDD